MKKALRAIAEKPVVRPVVGAVRGFLEHDAPSMGGALAFYSALSLAPMLTLLLWVGSWLGSEARDGLVDQLVGLVGEQGGSAVRGIAREGAARPDLGNIAGIVSLFALLFSATAAFAQLQSSLNRIWGVTAKPRSGVWGWLRKRLLSLGMVVTIGFLLLVSLAVSAALAMVFGKQDGEGLLWKGANFLVSLLVIVALFAALFRFLPDVELSWRRVLPGALATAALFALGKVLIGLYLGRSSLGSAYGAAGSLLVLLVWIYYSSQIVFFGAELSREWLAQRGIRVQPNEHAVAVEENTREVPGAPAGGNAAGPRAPAGE